MNSAVDKILTLGFHGKIIDHLGIQMYQSPTAAVAEMVSNAWDADADKVNINFSFPDDISDWEISIADDGSGMTFDECQSRYLSVGYNRRTVAGPSEKTSGKNRPVMGRKGIGKFAGFGIARYIDVSTCAKATGECTNFTLDLNSIREGDSYISTDPLRIQAETHSGTEWYGTKITLRGLTLTRRIPEEQFSQSLARRFVINTITDEFEIKLNGKIIDSLVDDSGIELNFPNDMSEEERDQNGITIDDGWGIKEISPGRVIKWRVLFMRELIKDTELQGLAVFAHKKLAQRAFMFNLSGGLPSQAGPEYMTGQVIADWVDELGDDVISTERQRLNWESSELVPFEEWGQAQIRRLLSIWKDKRTKKKMAALEERVGAFSDRLNALGYEARTVRKALEKLAQIEKLNESQFTEMGNAILLAWEGGRLRELVSRLAEIDEMDEGNLLALLAESNAITALHTAETIRAKLSAIEGLEARVNKKELENAVRDYIAKSPWLISPLWETFAVEKRAAHVLNESATRAGISIDNDDYKGRVDLVLSSGKQLLLLEFMRPGLKLDRAHIDRFNHYLDIIQEKITSITALGFTRISGYLVADSVEQGAGNRTAIEQGRVRERYVMDWNTLIDSAKSQWKEFFENVKDRAPDDVRVQSIELSERS